jgi:osmotically inducible protein OsmC
MQRKASAAWQGGLRDGKGTLTTESKALSGTPYSFGTRFEGAPGIKPERIDVAVKAPGADRGKFDEAARLDA